VDFKKRESKEYVDNSQIDKSVLKKQNNQESKKELIEVISLPDLVQVLNDIT
jgi:hypothetical protein